MLRHQIRARSETATLTRGHARVTIRVRRPGLLRAPVVTLDLHGVEAAVATDPHGGWTEVRHPAGAFRYWLEPAEPGKTGGHRYHKLVIVADRAWRIAWEAGEPEPAQGVGA